MASATAQPKRDYYYQSRLGNRVFDLDLGSVALAFAGASTPEHQRDIDAVLAAHGAPDFTAQPPRTEERLRKKPLGIYINGLAWSRELDSTEGARKP